MRIASLALPVAAAGLVVLAGVLAPMQYGGGGGGGDAGGGGTRASPGLDMLLLAAAWLGPALLWRRRLGT